MFFNFAARFGSTAFTSIVFTLLALGKIPMKEFFHNTSLGRKGNSDGCYCNITHPLFPLSLLVVHGVHVHGERDVLHHHEDVGHGYARENEVDRVVTHILVTQHNNVEKVEESSENTN